MNKMADTNSPAPPQRRISLWLLAPAGIALGFLLVFLLLQLLGSTLFGPRSLHGTVLQSPEPMANFTLTAHTGQPVNLHDYQDKVVMLYFGYTFCPDACPATMSHLAQAMEKLTSAQQEQIQVFMITVDPERDTKEQLADYMAYFHPSFVGLTGTAEEIAQVATPLGIYYRREAGTAASGYLVNHTTSVLVIDKKGHLRLTYPFNTPVEDIAADMRILVRE